MHGPGTGEHPADRITRRTLLRASLVALAAGSALLLSACGGGAPGSQPGASSAATSAASGSAAGKVEPRGRMTYIWHTTIAPSWLDPQEAPPQVTPYSFCYALHDAMVKHMPGKTFAPSLAESYELSPDFRSATFKLRPGIKFHDGSPVMPEDVKFSFEKYRGASAKVLHEKTERVETADNRTIRFQFKEPFLDFMILYGSPASGAGWVVPKAYYEKVGPSGFAQKPIGAGPYRLVRQQAGSEIELEAFTDYWRKTPSVKTLIIKAIPEGATRVALLSTGEGDFVNSIPGQLLETVRRDPKVQLVPAAAGAVWLEPMAFDRPDTPLKDVRVRQAVSLALDRKAINEAEVGGYARMEGNWIQSDWPGSVQRPSPPFDLARAKQLMAEAGVANGFEVSAITPLPPQFSTAERIISQLRAINIVSKVNIMERGAFYERLAPGPNRLKGLVLQFSGAPGDAAARIRENATCKGGFSGLCLPEVEEKMQRYDASANPQERERLLTEVQNYLLDQYILIPVYINALIVAQGPRVANKPTEIIGAVPQFPWPGPWEDVVLKE